MRDFIVRAERRARRCFFGLYNARARTMLNVLTLKNVRAHTVIRFAVITETKTYVRKYFTDKY